MDGVIVDNATFHFESWREACQHYGLDLTEEYYQSQLNGRTMENALHILFGRKLSHEALKKFEDEKEGLYREVYKDHIKPTPGLIDFLHSLRAAGFPCVVATSAPPQNVDFTLDGTHTRHFFKDIVDASMISRGKPNPEVFLKAADVMDMIPSRCIVFEDAIMGIKAGKAAGMKVIAMATTHPASALGEADKIIHDFSELNLKMIRMMVKS